MVTFDDIWKFLEFGNWKSGNLESARNWLVLANFNILGIFPTQFRSLSLILNSEFQISNFSGIWKLEIWKSGNSQKLTSFWPISIYRVFFPLSLGHKTWFWTQNFKFPIFLDFFWKYSGNLEILWNLLFLTNLHVWGIISTWFQSLKLILHSEYQISNFSGFFFWKFPENFLNFFSGNFLKIFWKSGNFQIFR